MNIERMISDHGNTTLEDLDLDIRNTLEKLRELQRRRVILSMHISIAQVSDVDLPAFFHSADTHDYTESEA